MTIRKNEERLWWLQTCETVSKNYIWRIMKKMEPFDIGIIIFVVELNFYWNNVRHSWLLTHEWVRLVHRTITRARQRRITYRIARDASLRRVRFANSRDHICGKCVRDEHTDRLPAGCAALGRGFSRRHGPCVLLPGLETRVPFWIPWSPDQRGPVS